MENINLLRKIAWNFHKSTGLDWDDLFSEAVNAYYQVLDDYEPSKGKITTFLWIGVSNGLKNYLKKQKGIEEPLTSLEDGGVYYLPANNPIPFWESLTQEAQGIANMILTYANTFINIPPEDIDDFIFFIMRKQSWSDNKIKVGLHDLKIACGVTFINNIV
jgi:hypothetical protein